MGVWGSDLVLQGGAHGDGDHAVVAGEDLLGALGGLARAVTNTVAVAAPIALLILSALALVGDSYNPFLYFRF